MRFHFGMSFSFRKIKKYIIPFLLGILAFFGFSKLNIMTVYALSNYDTSYTLTIPEEQQFESDFTSDNNYIEFVDYITSFNSDYYYYYVMYYHNSSNVVIRLVSKNVTNFNTSFVGYAQSSTVSNSNLQFILFTQANISYKEFTFIKEISSTTSNKSGLSEFTNCYVNNVCPSSSSSSTYWAYSTSSTNHENILTTSRMNISNDNNINLDSVLSTFSLYIYKTDIDYTYGQINYGSNTGSRYFYKNVIINGIDLSVLGTLPTYYSLYLDFGDTTVKKYDNILGDIFLGGVSPSDFSTLRLDLQFNYSDFDYVDSFQYKYLYFGRINNSDNYYSYEELNCSSGLLSGASINQDNKFYKVSFTSPGLSCSQTLSNYDKIYVRIYYLFDTSTQTSISNLSSSVNHGFVSILDSSLVTSNGLYIYERFDNLPSTFTILLSTPKEKQKAYYISDNKYIVLSNISYDNKISNISYNPINFGEDFNSNAIIYNMTNYNDSLSDLNLYLNYDTIYSYSSININSDLYYYDSSSTITHSNISNNFANVVNDTYNVDNYFSVVSGFLDDIKTDISSFSDLVQFSYDSIPIQFQTIIFVFFILGCFALIYKLINK